jgi:SAM-dependent methyltransferase
VNADDTEIISALQHNREIHRNRESWARRPLLRQIYADFYQLIKGRLAPREGVILELGSGMGNVKDSIPECITSDLFPNPWLDRQENAYKLSFADAAIGNLILFDVWHHLRYPGTALNEFRRVLQIGGRLIIFDPAMGLLGRFVYGCFHHEPLGLTEPIEWFAPRGFKPEEAPYYAAQGNASRIFAENSACRKDLQSWRILEVKPLAALSYVGSGGFSKPQLYPTKLYRVGRAFDKQLSKWPRIFATRILIVLERSV